MENASRTSTPAPSPSEREISETKLRSLQSNREKEATVRLQRLSGVSFWFINIIILMSCSAALHFTTKQLAYFTIQPNFPKPEYKDEKKNSKKIIDMVFIITKNISDLFTIFFYKYISRVVQVFYCVLSDCCGMTKIYRLFRACDYCPEYKKREMKFAYSFQGKKVLRCAVEVNSL